MSTTVLIEAKGLAKEYIRGKREVVMALNDVDLQIPKGKLVMVTGPSGSGKSTLLNVLSGLDRPTEGKVIYEDENIADWDEEKLSEFRRGNVGFIFQNFNLFCNMIRQGQIAAASGKKIACKARGLCGTFRSEGIHMN